MGGGLEGRCVGRVCGEDVVRQHPHRIQTPGNYPEESIQHSEHGESLKSSIKILINIFVPNLIFNHLLRTRFIFSFILPYFYDWILLERHSL
jgi:hypothetical protein